MIPFIPLSRGIESELQYQMDYGLLLLCAVLLLLAAVCYHKKKDYATPLFWLGAFSLLQAVCVWLNILVFSLDDVALLAWLIAGSAAASLAAAFAFCRDCLQTAKRLNQPAIAVLCYSAAVLLTLGLPYAVKTGVATDGMIIIFGFALLVFKSVIAFWQCLFLLGNPLANLGISKRQFLCCGVLLVGLFLGGWGATQYVACEADKEFRENLRSQTEIAALAVTPEQIKRFDDFLEKKDNSAYTYTSHSLEAVKASNVHIKWAYMMVNRGQTILFAYSSRTQYDNADPGGPYVLPPPELMQVFADGQTMTAGPYTDEWGTFLSGFAAVRDPVSGSLIGVLGIDVAGENWQRMVYKDRRPPIHVTLLIYLILLLFALARQRLWESAARIAVSEERLNLALQGANDGLWDWNLVNNEVYFSPQWKKMLGYAEDEIPHTPQAWEALLHPDEKGRIIEQLRDYVTGKSEKLEYEVRMKRKEGGYCDILVRSFAVRWGENGTAVRLVGTHVDMTERNRIARELLQAKEAAEEAARMKSAFLANMSHEIRTPMNAILGFTQLLQRDGELRPKQRRQIETIQRSGEHLLALINDILEMSKIEAGRIEAHTEEFDFKQMIDDVEMLFQARVKEKQLFFQVQAEGHMPVAIVSDKQKLRQILINLVGNAVKFTVQGGITLTVKQSLVENGGIRLLCRVEDTGPGIGPDEVGKLFHMFSQASAGVKSGGTGLGLAISRQYARLLGGDITVQSVLGTGSIFALTVLAAVGGGTAVEADAGAPQVRSVCAGETCRILLVDDIEENRQVLGELLRDVGFVTVEAVDGEQAVELVRTQPPQLVFMDVRLPGMNGYEATRRIRELQPSLPVVGISASVLPEDWLKAKGSGMAQFVQKPFRQQDVFAAIAACLPVTYRYDEPIDEELAAGGEDDISQLPAELAVNIREAVLRARMDDFSSLMTELEQSSPSLAAKLRGLADLFEYDTLLDLLKGAIEHE